MSQAWPRVRLGRLLTRSEERAEIRPDRSYRQITVRLWGAGVALRDKVSGMKIRARMRYIAREGQFILSRIDARNGAFGLVPDFLDGAVVSSDFPCFDIDQARLLPVYLEWMSKTHGFVELCQKASEGTTNRVRLQLDRFSRLEIPLPPLVEQRRIVARIEELAAKVEAARALREEVAEGIQRLVPSLHCELAQSRMVRVGDILTLDEQKEDIVFGEQYPQVGIKSFGKGLFGKRAIDASQTSYKAFNRLYEGAVVLSQVKGWEGAIAVCGRDLAGFYASPEYRTFRCIPGEALPDYLADLVVTPWFYSRLDAATRGVGARRQRTRPELFLDLEVPMPRIEQQQTAIPIFERARVILEHQAVAAEALDALLPSILDKAFKGEL